VLFPWKNAQRFVHVNIQSLSFQWPFLSPSSDSSARLATVCSGGNVVVVSIAVGVYTTTICCPLGVSTTLGTCQSAHVCSSVYETLLQVISCFPLGWLSWSQFCPSIYIYTVWSTSQPLTLPLLPSLHWISVKIYYYLSRIFVCVMYSLDALPQ
jgi:hypothetical protein